MRTLLLSLALSVFGAAFLGGRTRTQLWKGLFVTLEVGSIVRRDVSLGEFIKMNEL